ncbi:MAG: hypothetical protein IJ217_01790 [Clostridia bacterium]|nr:hypothetical protein [Clostridia bacterium]
MKKMKVLSAILTVSMVLCMFSSIALATVPTVGEGGAFASAIEPAVSAVLGVVFYIALAVAVGILIYIGIKYMTKGAGGKAEVKDTLLPFLIGAVIVGGASKLAQLAIDMGKGIN